MKKRKFETGNGITQSSVAKKLCRTQSKIGNALTPGKQREAHLVDGQVFTLVELLVVISIISILAALLLPALKIAKGQASRIVCVSNLSQLGKAVNMYADDSNNQWPQFTGNTTWTYNWAYYSNKWEAVGRLYAGDYVNAKQSFFCPCDDVYIGNLAVNWKNPGNNSIGTSYCLRGYDQTLKGKVGPKLDGVSNRAVISCYFLYSPGQYPRLAFHRTTYTYPVLFGDGHVSIAKFPSCFSRYQPPDLSNNTYQHPFWDSHDTYQ